MQYRLVALFAMAAIAAPIENGDGILTRSDESHIGDVNVGTNLLRDESTGVKNAKREENGFIADYAQLASDIANAMKRSDEGLIGDLNVGTNVGSDDSTGVKNAKRAEDVSIGGVEAGTPILDIENAKRDEDLLVAPITIGAISL
ncbi:hypothetical protein N7490_005540 [Penicillium lividum]|nr:hypothetical protein N7490_005540 [Penicillium lividum]